MMKENELNILMVQLESNIVEMIKNHQYTEAKYLIDEAIKILEATNIFNASIYYFKFHIASHENDLEVIKYCADIFLRDYSSNPIVTRQYQILFKEVLYSRLLIMSQENINPIKQLLWIGILEVLSRALGDTSEFYEELNVLRDSIQIEHLLTNRRKMIILDKNCPDITSGFSVAEFNTYFKLIKDSCLLSESPEFSLKSLKYEEKFPETKGKFDYFNFYELINELKGLELFYESSLAYMLFLEQAYKYLPILEALSIPFVFTLYSTVGYIPRNPDSDARLHAVCSSKFLKKVIVCSQLDYKYLHDIIGVPSEKLEYIYGVVTQAEYWEKNKQEKMYYKKDKTTFDICFVAHRYTPRGENKGYPLFVEIIQELAQKYEDMRFHVVGGFSKDDIDIADAIEKVSFYGKQSQHFFPDFYKNMDIMLNLEQNCNYDQRQVFMSASAAQSGLNEVAVFVLDEHNINTEFESGYHLEILKNDTQYIIEIIEKYYTNVDQLYQLANRGMIKFREVYGYQSQMEPRVKLLRSFFTS